MDASIGAQYNRTHGVLLADASSSGDALEEELISANLFAGRARNNDEALALMRELRPEWALVELRVGSDDGLELLDEMARSLLGTRTIIVTMYGTVSAACEAMNRGAVGFFTKPVTVAQITAGLCEQLRNQLPVETAAPHPWLSVDDMRCRYIREVVEHCGSLTQAAKALHVDRRSLRRMMKRLGLRA